MSATMKGCEIVLSKPIGSGSAPSGPPRESGRFEGKFPAVLYQAGYRFLYQARAKKRAEASHVWHRELSLPGSPV